MIIAIVYKEVYIVILTNNNLNWVLQQVISISRYFRNLQSMLLNQLFIMAKIKAHINTLK